MDPFKIAPQVGLEPYAVQLRLSRLEQDDRISLDSAAIFLIHDLARRCMLEEGALIGHIKGFAKGEGENWFKVSLTDGRRPVDFEGSINDTKGPVVFTLNAHVLGLAACRVETLMMETITTLGRQWEVNVAPVCQGN